MHQWLLKRNCSMSPRQVGIAFGALGALILAIGLVFAARGLWFVLAFAALEFGALLLALLHYARHASDHEHIALSEGCLLIERVEAGRLHQVRLDPCWTRIAPPDRHHPLILLKARGVRVDVGSFVSAETREQVARELRRELSSASMLSQPRRDDD
jgi:uncharacterized membrane protein